MLENEAVGNNHQNEFKKEKYKKCIENKRGKIKKKKWKKKKKRTKSMKKLNLKFLLKPSDVGVIEEEK